MGARTLVDVDALVGTELDGLVDTLESGSVRMTEDALTGRGLVVPPTVHMMSRYARPPYLGAVTTRGFYRGADAAEAVTRLALLPAAAGALRLLVVWEHADLCASLDLPGWQEEGRYSRGLVVLDAHCDEGLGHTVRWHPFELVGVDPSTRLGHRGLIAEGWPVVPRWGSPARHPGGWLPDPVAQLLAVWRAGGAGDRGAVGRVRAELTASGFVVLWKQP